MPMKLSGMRSNRLDQTKYAAYLSERDPPEPVLWGVLFSYDL